MTRYTFSLARPGMTADVGAVLSDSFAGALDAIAREPLVAAGDVLEIGVPGFPPARYECVATGADGRSFRPSMRLAA